MQAFTPVDNATASVSVTGTTARSLIKGAPSGAFQLRLFNAGSATVFYATGGAAVVAETTDVPLPAGAIEVITVQNRDASPETYIAAITASGTATLYATTGEGI